MFDNSFYESNNNFRLIKRESSNLKKDLWTMKKMSFSGKYIAEMLSLKKFLVSECDFKLVCFCESCKESKSDICFT